MKNTTIAFLSLLLFVAVSCGSDDPAPSQEFRATVNGEEFSAAVFYGEYTDLFVNVLGTSTTGAMFSLEISTDVETGTHDMPDEASIIFYDEDGKSYAVDSGEINITVFTSERFEATFNFEGFAVTGGQQDMTVTNGVIRVDLEEQ
jgi:hypothetical protein